MADLFKTKVRRVGTSLGVLIPKETVDISGISEGEEIEVGIVKRKGVSDIMSFFGTAKKSKTFERERAGRAGG